MIDGVNGSQTINWLNIINSYKKQNSGTSQAETGSSASGDSVELSQQAFQALGGGTAQQNPLESLVSNGTITQDQATDIDKALKSAMDAGIVPGSGQSPLAGLVSAGTITQDQADSVKGVMEASRAANGGPGSQMANVLDSLVSNGTITQDQANAVTSALQSHHHAGGGKPPAASATQSSSSTDDSTSTSGLSEEEILQLLSEGKITAAQANKALTALEASGAKQSSDSTTATSASGATNASPLEKLVTSGVITNDQKDAIQAAFKNAMDVRMAAQAYSAQGSGNYQNASAAASILGTAEI